MTLPPTPVLQTPPMDTLISSMSMFSTVLLGLLGLFLAVISGIGGFLVWNGFVLRARAEKDLEKIELLGERIEARAKEIEAIFNQAQSMVTKLTDDARSLLKLVSDAQNIAERLDIKDKKFTALLSDVEQRVDTFSNSNTLQHSASLMNSPALAPNFVGTRSQLLSFSQPSCLQFPPAVCANPSPHPLMSDLHNPSLATTGMMNPSLATTGMINPLAITGMNVLGSLH